MRLTLDMRGPTVNFKSATKCHEATFQAQIFLSDMMCRSYIHKKKFTITTWNKTYVIVGSAVTYKTDICDTVNIMKLN